MFSCETQRILIFVNCWGCSLTFDDKNSHFVLNAESEVILSRFIIPSLLTVLPGSTQVKSFYSSFLRHSLFLPFPLYSIYSVYSHLLMVSWFDVYHDIRWWFPTLFALGPHFDITNGNMAPPGYILFIFLKVIFDQFLHPMLIKNTALDDSRHWK